MGGIPSAACFDLPENVEHFDGFYLGDRSVPNGASQVLQHPAVLVESLFGRAIFLQVGKVFVCHRAEGIFEPRRRWLAFRSSC
jgi:hypothetical protein